MIKENTLIELVVWVGGFLLIISIVICIVAANLTHQITNVAFSLPTDLNTEKYMPPYKELVVSQDVSNAEQGAYLNTYAKVLAYINYANPNLTDEARKDMGQAIIKYATQYNLPVGLVVGVINAESTFKADAVGKRTLSGKAKGPMQVMWPLHKDLAHSLGVNNVTILTADGGVKVGCCLLKRYIQNTKSILGGLAHYFSAPSKRYVLDAVITTYLAFEQLEHGLASVDMIPVIHTNEVQTMGKLAGKKR